MYKCDVNKLGKKIFEPNVLKDELYKEIKGREINRKYKNVVILLIDIVFLFMVFMAEHNSTYNIISSMFLFIVVFIINIIGLRLLKMKHEDWNINSVDEISFKDDYTLYVRFGRPEYQSFQKDYYIEYRILFRDGMYIDKKLEFKVEVTDGECIYLSERTANGYVTYKHSLKFNKFTEFALFRYSLKDSNDMEYPKYWKYLYDNFKSDSI